MQHEYSKKCKNCKKVFFATKISQLYCSKPCQESAWQDRNRKEKEKSLKVCISCGQTFYTSDARKLYCSKTCLWHYHNSKRDTAKKHQKPCTVCGKMYVPKNSLSKFCSTVCRNKHGYEAFKKKPSLRERQRAWAKKNKWDGNWEAALKRDEYTCQLCGIKIIPSRWTKTKRLEVHHKDGTGEHANKNHSLDNLQTFCSACHREFHTKINLVFRNGEYFVTGKIFEHLGIQTIKTINL